VDGEEHRPHAPPLPPRQGRVAACVSPGAVVVVRAWLGEVLARPVAGSGLLLSSPLAVLIAGDLLPEPEPRGSWIHCRWSWVGLGGSPAACARSPPLPVSWVRGSASAAL